MIPAAAPRSVAIALLRFAIWIAPHDTHDWGHAMLNELNHVQGNWSALLWSLGGAGVLAKHAILAVILPGTHRRTVSSASELFEKEGPMRKPALAAIASCVLASLLFFLLPVFRQAFRVSLAQWHDILHAGQPWTGRGPALELEALARKAEQNHDAEGIAFAAVRLTSQSENTKLAEEAVRLDPNLTWVYAVVVVQCPWRSEINHWIPVLEQWDPQNALPHLIDAERIDVDQVVRETAPRRIEDEPAAWQNAMAAAFQSQKIDDYSMRLKELDRRVLLRYRIADPFQASTDRRWSGLPSYSPADSRRYAKMLLAAGQSAEAKGDAKGASERYLAVARFGQMMGPAAVLFLGREVQEAYSRLGAISAAKGNKVEAAFYSSLGDQIGMAHQEVLVSLGNWVKGSGVSRWNALLVKASGLVVLFSGLLLLTCVLAVIVRGKTLRLTALRPSRLTAAAGLCGAIGALLSSAVLYVSYRPYAEILQRFIRNGDEGGLSELSHFLDATQVPLGARGFLDGWNFVFYFWFGVALLCTLALLIAVLRHLQTRLRTTAA